MEQALAYVCCSAEESRVKVQKYCRKIYELGYVPVSYTHLDVYKRQEVICLEKRKMKSMCIHTLQPAMLMQEKPDLQGVIIMTCLLYTSTMQNVLQYQGKYYVCGTGRQTLVKNKTSNDNYYLLTLAAIAEEIKQDVYKRQLLYSIR